MGLVTFLGVILICAAFVVYMIAKIKNEWDHKGKEIDESIQKMKAQQPPEFVDSEEFLVQGNQSANSGDKITQVISHHSPGAKSCTRPIVIVIVLLLIIFLAFHIGSRVALSNRIQASIERAPYGGVSITTPTGTHEYRVSNKAKVSLSLFLDRLIIEDDRRLLVIPVSEGITVL